jgi:hypothetical protein
VLLFFYRFDFGLLLTLSFCIIHASWPLPPTKRQPQVSIIKAIYFLFKIGSSNKYIVALIGFPPHEGLVNFVLFRCSSKEFLATTFC